MLSCRGKIEVLHAACGRVGRDPNTITIAMVLYWDGRSRASLTDQIGRLGEAGAQLVMLAIPVNDRRLLATVVDAMTSCTSTSMWMRTSTTHKPTRPAIDWPMGNHRRLTASERIGNIRPRPLAVVASSTSTQVEKGTDLGELCVFSRPFTPTLSTTSVSHPLVQGSSEGDSPSLTNRFNFNANERTRPVADDRRRLLGLDGLLDGVVNGRRLAHRCRR